MAKKIAWALHRVSTKKQISDKDDIPMQKNECRAFVQEKGWYLEKEIVEKGISGFKKNSFDRDAINEIIEGAKQHRFQILLIFMLDRIGRRGMETAYLLQTIESMGIQIWEAKSKQQITFDGGGNAITSSIRCIFAQEESKRTSERITTRMRQLVSEGKYTGRIPPYGYKVVPTGEIDRKGHVKHDMVKVEEEAEVVREVFEKTIREGYGSYRLAQYLNEKGYRTHRGAKFRCNNINRMLKDRLYLGYYVSKGVQSPKIDKLVIIDEATFSAAQEILARRAEKDADKRDIALRTQSKTLLNGVLYCSTCGKRLMATSTNDNYTRKDGTKVRNLKPRYVCYNKSHQQGNGQKAFLAERLDNAAREIIKSYLARIKETPKDKALESRYRKKLAEQKKIHRALLTEVERQKKRLESLMSEVAKSLTGESTFSPDILNQSIEATRLEISQTNEKLGECEAAMENKETAYNHLDIYYKQFQSWADEFDGATTDEQKMIITQLVRKIYVSDNYKMEFVFNINYDQFFQK